MYIVVDQEITVMIEDITPKHDSKLQELFRVISKKIEDPVNDGNKKIIIFTAFADTADYLYENVSVFDKASSPGYIIHIGKLDFDLSAKSEELLSILVVGIKIVDACNICQLNVHYAR